MRRILKWAIPTIIIGAAAGYGINEAEKANWREYVDSASFFYQEVVRHKKLVIGTYADLVGKMNKLGADKLTCSDGRTISWKAVEQLARERVAELRGLESKKAVVDAAISSGYRWSEELEKIVGKRKDNPLRFQYARDTSVKLRDIEIALIERCLKEKEDYPM